ncbi:MAG TPA: 4Fe-4S dicluster domain-containing protein [Methanoregula sp.]|nr:4Fe-4S dicluster domain-containing protein [Methanoregula sp.]
MGFFEMTKTALRTVLSRPATILYPAQAAKRTPLTRGHIIFDGSRCISCSICQRKCPAQALLLNKEAKTWQIDRFRCVMCGACVYNCPATCLSMDPVYTPPASEKGVEVFAITYVKPPRPEKKEEPKQ